MSKVQEVKEAAKRNIDTRIVVSAIAATVIIGVGLYAMKRFGGKAGKAAAEIVKGGK